MYCLLHSNCDCIGGEKIYFSKLSNQRFFFGGGIQIALSSNALPYDVYLMFAFL